MMHDARRKAGMARRTWRRVRGVLLAAVLGAIATTPALALAQTTSSQQGDASGSALSNPQFKYKLRVVDVVKDATTKVAQCIVLNEIGRDNRQAYCIYRDNNKWYRDDNEIRSKQPKKAQSVPEASLVSTITLKIQEWLKNNGFEFADSDVHLISQLIVDKLTANTQTDDTTLEKLAMSGIDLSKKDARAVLRLASDVNLPALDYVEQVHLVLETDKIADEGQTTAAATISESTRPPQDEDPEKQCVSGLLEYLKTRTAGSAWRDDQCPPSLSPLLARLSADYGDLQDRLHAAQKQINESQPLYDRLGEIEKRQWWIAIGIGAGLVLICLLIVAGLLYGRFKDRPSPTVGKESPGSNFEGIIQNERRHVVDDGGADVGLHRELRSAKQTLHEQKEQLARLLERNKDLDSELNMARADKDKAEQIAQGASTATAFLFDKLSRLDHSLRSIDGQNWQAQVENAINTVQEDRRVLDDLHAAAGGSGNREDFVAAMRSLLGNARRDGGMGSLSAVEMLRCLDDRLPQIADLEKSRRLMVDLLGRRPAQDERLVDLADEACRRVAGEREKAQELASENSSLEKQVMEASLERDRLVGAAGRLLDYLDLRNGDAESSERIGDWADKLEIERREVGHRSLRLTLTSVLQDWEKAIGALRDAGREDLINALNLHDVADACRDLLDRLAMMPDGRRLWHEGLYPGFNDKWLQRLFRAEQILDAYLWDTPACAPLRDVVREAAAAFRRSLRQLRIEVLPTRIGSSPPADATIRYKLTETLSSLREVRDELDVWSRRSETPVVDINGFGYRGDGTSASMPDVCLLNPAEYRS